MQMPWKDEITRRTLLRLGITSAALAAVPWPAFRRAQADPLNPHLFVVFYADGGWDVTQVLDPHDPADTTDNIDVDVAQAISGFPPSVLATAGPITYCSNSTSRPMADTFFQTWSGKSAVVNAIGTRSTSHDQSRQLVATGYLDPTRPDFAVMAAHHLGETLPLPHLLLSGPGFDGPYGGLTGRVGGQLGQALAYDTIVSAADGSTPQLAASALGEAYIQQALEQQRMLDVAGPGGAVTGKLSQFQDAQVRGDKLAHLARSLPQGTNQGMQLATSLGNAFRQGLTTSVTINQVGGFDTHSNNFDQDNNWNDLFQFLNDFVTGLSTQPGLVSSSLLDETTIVYFSEFGRTPQLNGNNGKDHHPWTSILVVGKGVAPGVYGLTDGNQEGVKTNFSTGKPDDTGMVIDVTNMVAGLVTLAGANASDYLPNGVKPFTAMIA